MPTASAQNYPINCGLATSSFARAFTKRAISDRKFDLVATESKRVISSGGESVVAINKDDGLSSPHLKNVVRKTSAAYETDFLVAANIRGTGYFQAISLTSDNPGILGNPSAAGLATFQSAGACVFRGESLDGEVSLVRVNSSTATPATVDTFQSWVTGSLARHCTDQIDSLIAGKSQLNIYTDYQYYGTSQTNTFQRNSACWANGVDLSCASPWNSDSGALKAGTLVSPRHVVFCNHSFHPQDGSTMFFSSSSSAVISRTLTTSVGIEGVDIRVGVLHADVDGGVGFAKVLPQTYADYLPGLLPSATVPVMCLNQTERASISALFNLSAAGFKNTYPTSYASHYGSIVHYDSGNPAFLVVNGSVVLLGVFTGGGSGTGAFISHHATAVNAAMTSLGGGYQLTPVDLSGFTNYA